MLKAAFHPESLFSLINIPAELQFKPALNRTQSLSKARSTPILPRRNSALRDKNETPQEMLVAALSGDTTALDRLDAFASAATENKSPEQMEAVLNQNPCAAFSMMSEEAGNGNSDALGISGAPLANPTSLGSPPIPSATPPHSAVNSLWNFSSIRNNTEFSSPQRLVLSSKLPVPEMNLPSKLSPQSFRMMVNGPFVPGRLRS